MEPTAEESIKSAQPFLRTSQSTSFDIHFRDYSQYSTYICINTWLNTVLIPLCYASWIILKNIILQLMRPPTLPIWSFNSHLSSQNYWIGIIFSYNSYYNSFYFLCTPLHRLAYYTLSCQVMLVSFISQ